VEGGAPPEYSDDRIRAIADRFPEYADLWDRLAWSYVGHPCTPPDAQRAMPYALLATRIQPRYADYWHTLAVVYYRLGQYDRAMAAWQMDLKLPGSAESASELFFFAMNYQRQGQVKQARDCYDRAVQWLSNNSADLPPRVVDNIETSRAEAAASLGISLK
jgi:tetratricopeptide (TPR) repeat protein